MNLSDINFVTDTVGSDETSTEGLIGVGVTAILIIIALIATVILLTFVLMCQRKRPSKSIIIVCME